MRKRILNLIAWIYVNVFCWQTWRDRFAIWRFNRQMRFIRKQLNKADKQGHW